MSGMPGSARGGRRRRRRARPPPARATSASPSRERLGGEVVNADSMQLYRGMDIGTAKLTRRGAAGRAAPPARRVGRARAGQRRGLPAPGPGGDRRHRVARPNPGAGRRVGPVRAGRPGPPRLSRAPTQRSVAAWRPTSPRRAPRACTPGWPRPTRPRPPRSCRATAAGWCARSRSSSSPGPTPRRCPSPRYAVPAVQVGLAVERPVLDERIARARRPDVGARAASTRCARWPSGGCARAGPRRRALGYAQVLRHLAGEWTEEQAREETVRATRRFARRQESWFRRDPRVVWLAGTTISTGWQKVRCGIWAVWPDPDRDVRSAVVCAACPSSLPR